MCKKKIAKLVIVYSSCLSDLILLPEKMEQALEFGWIGGSKQFRKDIGIGKGPTLQNDWEGIWGRYDDGMIDALELKWVVAYTEMGLRRR